MSGKRASDQKQHAPATIARTEMYAFTLQDVPTAPRELITRIAHESKPGFLSSAVKSKLEFSGVLADAAEVPASRANFGSTEETL